MGERPVKNKTKDELITIVQHLIKENDILKDENETLWEMLEEIKEADKAAKLQMDKLDEQAMIELLLAQEPVGEA
jgi:regulator of replication initiation timing